MIWWEKSTRMRKFSRFHDMMRQNLSLLRSNTEWERLWSSVSEVLWWSWRFWMMKMINQKRIKSSQKSFFYSYNSIPNESFQKDFRIDSEVSKQISESFFYCAFVRGFNHFWSVIWVIFLRFFFLTSQILCTVQVSN